MKQCFLAILLLLATLPAYSQYSSSSKKAIKTYEKAQEAFMQRKDAVAEELLCKTLSIDDQFIEAWYMLAQVYLDKGDGITAAKHYLKGLEVDPSANPDGYLKVPVTEIIPEEFINQAFGF